MKDKYYKTTKPVKPVKTRRDLVADIIVLILALSLLAFMGIGVYNLITEGKWNL